jgi:hypothetical protein
MRKLTFFLLFLASAAFAQNPKIPCGTSNVNTSYIDAVNNVQWLCTTSGWKASTGIGAPAALCTSKNYGEPYTDVSTPATYACGTTGWFENANGSGLPTATTAGQVPVAGGPGTSYTAGFTSPGGNTFYLANYLANPSVPAQVRWDCSWGTGSSPQTITCPSGTFTPSMTGWVSWATQLNPGGNAPVANNFACGTAGTNATLTYVNSTTATINTGCSVASSSAGAGQGGYAFVFGPDETAGVGTWISAVANACGVGILPAGYVLTHQGGGGWNLTASQNTNCSNAYGTHSVGTLVKGLGQARSVIVIEPAFDFTTCTGGPTSNTCFGSAQTSTSLLVGGYSFSDFSISGFGISIDASTPTNWVEMLNGNYANNFAITKLGSPATQNTVGMKMNGSFGQFWNLQSDWAGAVPCWVASGGTYSPNVINGASECVGGSGYPINLAVCAGGGCGTYGLLVTQGVGVVSYGSI